MLEGRHLGVQYGCLCKGANSASGILLLMSCSNSKYPSHKSAATDDRNICSTLLGYTFLIVISLLTHRKSEQNDSIHNFGLDVSHRGRTPCHLYMFSQFAS